ncbi:SDR family NAD(P)-dependent oxidoreductase [Plastorhodobacter daqingensis]|uniref:SDR family NAD(P)-dependent oxidoreductase n=1 Tax=Plastorhodobacter daqingensis TaxID=1387281 RepID=A0ABW2UQE5_9RHOB
MKDWQGKRYWLVGASEGLGRALADRMSRAGVEIIASARNEARLADLVAELPGRSSYVPVDVSDRKSVEAAAAEVGPVDGVVYLAGVYWPVSATDWDPVHVERMCDVNFTGCARVMGAVVPGMIERGSGHVVITGSLSGFRGLPGAIGYGASKAAVMSLAESMRVDLRETGVAVQVVNPGFIRTRLTDKNDFSMPFMMEAEDAAREVFEHMTTDHFGKSFPRGFSWLFRAGRFLPDWAFYRLMGK